MILLEVFIRKFRLSRLLLFLHLLDVLFVFALTSSHNEFKCFCWGLQDWSHSVLYEGLYPLFFFSLKALNILVPLKVFSLFLSSVPSVMLSRYSWQICLQNFVRVIHIVFLYLISGWYLLTIHDRINSWIFCYRSFTGSFEYLTLVLWVFTGGRIN